MRIVGSMPGVCAANTALLLEWQEWAWQVAACWAALQGLQVHSSWARF